MKMAIEKPSTSTSDSEYPFKKSCCDSGDCGEITRRNFVTSIGIGTALGIGASTQNAFSADEKSINKAYKKFKTKFKHGDLPVLKTYDQNHVARIALPLGGIGTGTVSLGGRGDLRDWEIMNRSAKGFTPSRGEVAPFFVLFAQEQGKDSVTRILEGPIEQMDYEGSHGSTAPNENLPRFRYCSFAAAYPFGQVALSDPDVPVDVTLEAFNPLIPADPERSGIPAAVLTYKLRNTSNNPVTVSVCGNLPNFIGMDGWETTRDWKGDLNSSGAKQNRNSFKSNKDIQGILMASDGVEPGHETWGTMALSVNKNENATHRLDWTPDRWGSSILDFWDDFSVDGTIEERQLTGADMPIASLSVSKKLQPKETNEITFIITWHFPNRFTWTRRGEEFAKQDRIGNYYCTLYKDAWDVAENVFPQFGGLANDTLQFLNAFCDSSLPDVVKEAALFNVSTLRTQTCFRTADGRFFGYEGTGNHQGCCWGSCTHVWNYEQATAFLFGSLAMSMREVEFAHATDENGLMSFRIHLPIERAQQFGKAAADGQMGCIVKMYRDWQLSGDDEKLRSMWGSVKRTLSFCWIQGGWDADKDGVMEGCQHNTMDVEYYGPNPQMGIWYLAALRAAEEMANYLQDEEFAKTCNQLYQNGRQWVDRNLFNGEYYEHKIQPAKTKEDIAPSLLIGMGSQDVQNPLYQLGSGCLVDQLVGQFLAHVCGLGYLTNEDNVKQSLQSNLKYNGKSDLTEHFNSMRSFALGDEAALLMAAYPKDRPTNPFPYYTEAMTGFEYTAAIGLLYEGQIKEGLRVIQNIRDRYDGLKRNPFNEAECGHHYARAMASWAAVVALSGFHYSAVQKTIQFTEKTGNYFWSNGYAWGTCAIQKIGKNHKVDFTVLFGEIEFDRMMIGDESYKINNAGIMKAGESVVI
jgi:uncharacterized protein (DUF608 family)